MTAGGLGLAMLIITMNILVPKSLGAIAVGQENVGCLFSPAVCLEEAEWCFDDYAFGKCVPHGVDANSLYRFNLHREALHLLQREMERLLSLGYRWTHLYTQCVLQLKLNSIKEGEDFDKEICAPLKDQDLDSALKAFQGDDDLSAGEVAHVKYIPSAEDPHADFADEVYVPDDETINERVEGFPENIIQGQVDDYRDEDTPLRKILLKSGGVKKRQRFLKPTEVGVYPIESYLGEEKMIPSHHFSKQYNTPEGFRMGVEAKDLARALASEVKSFNRAYNTPDSFRMGIETKDFNNEDINEEDSVEDVYSAPMERELAYDTYRSDQNYEGGKHWYDARVPPFRMEDRLTHDLELLADDAVERADKEGERNDARVYTEGGFVEVPDEANEFARSDELVRDDNVNGGWGFKRRERLDVKKPGPNFSLNNFAFEKQQAKVSTPAPQSPPKIDEEIHKEAIPKKVVHSTTDPPTVRESQPSMTVEGQDRISLKKKGVGSPKGSPILRKISHANDDGEVFMKFRDPLEGWTDAVTILRYTAKQLDLDPNVFSHAHIEDDEVRFKVDRSIADLSVSEIAKRIESVTDNLMAQYGVEVVAVGSTQKQQPSITNRQDSQPEAVKMTTEEEHQLWLLSFLLCGIIAAVAIAGAAFFFIRRHKNTKEKLTGLKQPDCEASKDYQVERGILELCRARMAGKNSQPESAARMGSTSGEPKSPSSRSSTSSWSEEPAVSNMDISTGHMVLSYMEDHLKNKDRLEQEWVALCAYEAEPCAVSVATSEDNLKKNRYSDVLPYDHSRVVLNQLLNFSGSDYINASTINDHDPRNPAYIATQGPLEHTSADLWQMVWEQGSVVMVMLTRLTENGTTMCHRYWPEEGSQIYHIYEVHLVSEHVWCDDYLVRSFYLKNLKTGETRTVTQFHFLSWPENGVPLSTKALLEFRRKVNKSYRGRSCPIVVHCSDGVGRTGTYCLIDMVLNRMAKGAKEIDIAATLEHIRDQRPYMVKTKQQFEFVLMAVAEEVHAILKAMPATHSPPPVTKEKE